MHKIAYKGGRGGTHFVCRFIENAIIAETFKH